MRKIPKVVNSVSADDKISLYAQFILGFILKPAVILLMLITIIWAAISLILAFIIYGAECASSSILNGIVSLFDIDKRFKC